MALVPGRKWPVALVPGRKWPAAFVPGRQWPAAFVPDGQGVASGIGSRRAVSGQWHWFPMQAGSGHGIGS